jgi:O-antigen/teichoic acid export membrane protein
MPVLFRHLPKEELGVWLLLGQSWAAMGVLDLGLGVTLTRRIALAKGRSGADPDVPLTAETLGEIADLVASGQRIFRYMAIGVFAVSWVLGFFYLRALELQNLGHTTVWIAWTILCVCQALTVWATVWTCLLQGVGYVGWDAILASFISAAMLLGQIIAVLCGGGLVTLAAIAAVAALLQRAVTHDFARRRRPELFALPGRWNPTVLRGMGGLAFRAWLTAMGMMLVFNTDQFFVVSAAGAESIPAYRAAYVLVHNVTVLAVSLGLASVVFVSHYWQAGELRQVHRLVERNTRLALLVMLCSGALVITAGQSLFRLWLGPGNFIGYAIVGLFLAYETLEAHAYVISTSSRATEDEAFGFTSILAGVLKILLSLLLVQQWGLTGLALATLLALAATNHWYMIVRGLMRLQMPLGSYFARVVLPALAWSLGAFAAGWATAAALAASSDWVKLLSAAAAVGIVFTLAVLLLVLSPHERRRMRGKFAALVGRPTLF